VGHVQAPNVAVPRPLSVPMSPTSVASTAVASTPPTAWHGAVHNAGGADDGRPHVMGQAGASNPHPLTRHASHAQDATRTPMQHPTRPTPTRCGTRAASYSLVTRAPRRLGHASPVGAHHGQPGCGGGHAALCGSGKVREGRRLAVI